MIYELLYSLYLISLIRGAYQTYADFVDHPKIKYLIYQYTQKENNPMQSFYDIVEKSRKDEWESIESDDDTVSLPSVPSTQPVTRVLRQNNTHSVFT